MAGILDDRSWFHPRGRFDNFGGGNWKKTFLFLGDMKLLDSFDLLHGRGSLLRKALAKQHRRGIGEVLVVVCHKPQGRIELKDQLLSSLLGHLVVSITH